MSGTANSRDHGPNRRQLCQRRRHRAGLSSSGLASGIAGSVSLCPAGAIQTMAGVNLDLQTIAVLTRLPVRKIRYVLDHRLLPGLRVEGQPDLVGRARILTDLEAFAVACAAILLESGARKEAVVTLTTGLSEFPTGHSRRDKWPAFAIQKAFQSKVAPAEAMLGDGTNLRFKLGDRDSGWLQPSTFAPLAEAYRPRVVISLDLTRLRDAFLARR
jgi:hypothetical protein